MHPFLRPIVTESPPKRRRRYKQSIVVDKMDEFLRYVDPSLAPNTQRVVRKALWSLRKGLSGKEPTSENLLTWLRVRASVDRVSSGTIELERVYANKFFEWCISMGYMQRNPLKPIPHLPVKLSVKPVFTDEDYARLRKSAEGTILWPLLTVGWYTGARLGDICNLKWENVNFETGVLEFIPSKTKDKVRIVQLPLVEELRDLFKSWYDNRDSSTYVFPEAHQIYSRGDSSLQSMFRYVAGKAGISKKLSFHCLRHTRATRMLNGENKVDPLVAADFLGLSSLETLRGYTKISLDSKTKAMNL